MKLPRSRGARIAMLAALALVVLMLGATLLLRSLLSPEAVRRAIETEGSAALGLPIRVAGAHVGVFPRVSIKLEHVAVGAKAEIAIDQILVATGIEGLLRRRVEDAELVLKKPRVTLPLPPLAAGGGRSGGAAATPAPTGGDGGKGFTIASVRTVRVENLVVESGKEKVEVDLHGSLDGDRLKVDSLDLASGRTRIHGSADLESWKTLSGRFVLAATTLDVDGLLRLLPPSPAPGTAAARKAEGSGGRRLANQLEGRVSAESGWFRGVAFRDFATDVKVDESSLTFTPVKVKLLGGAYDGSIGVDTGAAANRIAYRGKLAGVDLAAVSEALGSKGAAGGTLGATLEFKTTGGTAPAVLARAGGKGTLEVKKLTLKGVDFLGTALTYLAAGASTGRSGEPGTLSATFTVAGGRLTSDDLRLTSPDFELRGKGGLGFDGTLDLAADFVLSEVLSASVGGRDIKYMMEGKRIVLPMKIGGNAADPRVTVDAAAMAKRAAGVAVQEGTRKAVESLGKKLFGGSK